MTSTPLTSTLLAPVPTATALVREPATPGRCRPRLRRIGTAAPDDGPRRPLPPPGPPTDAAAPTDADRLDAHRCTTRVLRLAVEVLDARRPIAHLAPHAEPSVLRYWRALTTARPAGRRPTRTGLPRLFLPGPGAAEMAVTCLVDGRPRALAARFEHDRGTWRCTALRLL